jgi:transposase InsO family protein
VEPVREQIFPPVRFAPNLLNRQFEAERPHTRWVTDTKAVETADDWLYLAAIVDLFSRLVVGWAILQYSSLVSLNREKLLH